MIKVLMICAALSAVAVAAPAAAQNISGEQTYGDATQVSGGYQLTSDPNAGVGYSGMYFKFDPGFKLNQLTTLSADYTLNAGSLVGGAPRFTIFDSSFGGAYIYFTGSPTIGDPTSTGNYASLLDATVRVECNGFAGCLPGYLNMTTFADFVAQSGTNDISRIYLDVDAGYSSKQQITVTAFNVNGYIFGETAAVPEPATWAMMLLGFGGIGASMRRLRKPTKIAQLA